MRTRYSSIIHFLLLAALFFAGVALIVLRSGVAPSPKPPAPSAQALPVVTARQFSNSQAIESAELQRSPVRTEINIFVHDESGAGIEGAELLVFDAAAVDATRKRQRIALSDPHGWIASNAQDREGTFIIKHVDYQSIILGEYARVRETRDVTLIPGATVSIQAIDEQGTPVSGVDIRITQPGRIAPSDEGVTDADGRIQFTCLAHGPFRIAAESDSHIVTDITVGYSAPTSGTIRLCRPLVAFGEARCSLHSFQAQMSASLLKKDAAPKGPAQASACRFADHLRGGSPSKVAMAMPPPLEGLSPEDCLEVSYLSGGGWGFARLPFRTMKPNLVPTPFGKPVSQSKGELVQLVVRTKTGQELDCSSMRLRIVPKDAPATAHAIPVYRTDQALRLPKGEYTLASECSAVARALGNRMFAITEDNPSDKVRRIDVALNRHLFVAKPRVRDPNTSSDPAIMRSGVVFVSSIDGYADVYYATDGNLADTCILLGEGLNTVRVTTLDGRGREFRVQTDASGIGVLTDDGRLIAQLK